MPFGKSIIRQSVVSTIIAEIVEKSLLHLMEARGLKQADLIGVIGSSGVVSEVINGKREISKAQAKALGDLFHVDAGLFI